MKMSAILLLLNFNFSTEINTADYSYFIFSIKANNVNQGTGFFLQKGENIYLVTAAHNFHLDKSSKTKTTDSFYLRLFTKDKSMFFLPVENQPIAKPSEYDNLDINFYKVIIPENCNINIIKLPKQKATNIKSLICYGYATLDGVDDDMNTYLKKIQPTEFLGSVFSDYDKPITYEDGVIDYNNFAAKYVSDKLGKGTSGAPIFNKTAANGKEAFEFIGLIHTRNEIYKEATMLRREVINEIFDKL